MGRDAHAVAIVVYDGVTMFELGVACDVFGNERAAMFGVPWYRSFVCGIAYKFGATGELPDTTGSRR